MIYSNALRESCTHHPRLGLGQRLDKLMKPRVVRGRHRIQDMVSSMLDGAVWPTAVMRYDPDRDRIRTAMPGLGDALLERAGRWARGGDNWTQHTGDEIADVPLGIRPQGSRTLMLGFGPWRQPGSPQSEIDGDHSLMSLVLQTGTPAVWTMAGERPEKTVAMALIFNGWVRHLPGYSTVLSLSTSNVRATSVHFKAVPVDIVLAAQSRTPPRIAWDDEEVSFGYEPFANLMTQYRDRIAGR